MVPSTTVLSFLCNQVLNQKNKETSKLDTTKMVTYILLEISILLPLRFVHLVRLPQILKKKMQRFRQ